MKIEFMSLGQWLDLYPEIKEQESECKECSGEGHSECGECGHERACEDRGGTGRINSVYSAYDEQKRRDVALLKKLNLPH